MESVIRFLNDRLGKKNYLVYFTATHGVSEIPAVMEHNRIPAGYFRQNQALQLLRSYLNAVYGEGNWVRGYSEKQVYLNRILIEDARIPLEEIQKKVARFMNQMTGVASAYPYSAFESNDYGGGHLKKIINNFSPQRSGDVIITLNPGWVEKDGEQITNHNSPYEYDSHVPLIWFTSTNSGRVRKALQDDIGTVHHLIAHQPVDGTVATVMPEVKDELGELGLYGWVFSGFFLASIVGIVVGGPAADRRGLVVPFTAGLVLFAAGLAVAGLAPEMATTRDWDSTRAPSRCASSSSTV